MQFNKLGKATTSGDGDEINLTYVILVYVYVYEYNDIWHFKGYETDKQFLKLPFLIRKCFYDAAAG